MKFNFTKRQQDVVNLLVKGLSDQEISVELNLGIKGVKHHLYTIYGKYNLKSRSHLIVEYYQNLLDDAQKKLKEQSLPELVKGI